MMLIRAKIRVKTRVQMIKKQTQKVLASKFAPATNLENWLNLGGLGALIAYFLFPIIHPNALYDIEEGIFIGAATSFASILADRFPHMSRDLTASSYPFRSAVLVAPMTNNSKGSALADITRRWTIEFYVWNIHKNKLQRTRRDFDINKFTTIAARKRRAQVYIDQINRDLKSGYIFSKAPKQKNPSPQKEQERINPDTLTFKKAMEFGLKIKSKGARKGSTDSWSSKLTILTDWMEEEELDNVLVKYINPLNIESFLSYLIEDREISNSTHNNYLEWISSIFNILVKMKVMDSNPCSGVSKLKTDQAISASFSHEQVKILKEKIHQKDAQLWTFAQWIYYSLARPKELRMLQVKHVQGHKIFIPSTISKNRKNGYVAITKGLAQVIEEMELYRYGPEDYLFTPDGTPGSRQVSKNHFTKRHLEVLRENGFSNEYDLYKWKHTGAVGLCLSGVNIKFIQMQLRHSSLEITDKYLRSLGVQMDGYMHDEIIAKAPSI